MNALARLSSYLGICHQSGSEHVNMLGSPHYPPLDFVFDDCFLLVRISTTVRRQLILIPLML